MKSKSSSVGNRPARTKKQHMASMRNWERGRLLYLVNNLRTIRTVGTIEHLQIQSALVKLDSVLASWSLNSKHLIEATSNE
jgi:hypothetical protein